MDRWRESGERIEALLDASSASGPVARERSEDLVREVMGLYGAGLARVCEIAAGHAAVMDEMVRDELITSLLIVHGLHPHDVETRVRAALDGVRPYLGSHGGDIELVGIADGVVRLRLLGSCHGCPSSAVTMELAVQDAVRTAAPEITDIEVGTTGAEHVTDGEHGLIPAESLFARVHTDVQGTWCAATEIGGIEEGRLGGFVVAGLPLLVCRLGGELLAYRDRCPACTHTFAGAALHRRAGHGADAAVLRCPTCAAHYDVRGAGVRLDAGDEHLEPVPVLVRAGVLSVAVPARVS